MSSLEKHPERKTNDNSHYYIDKKKGEGLPTALVRAHSLGTMLGILIPVQEKENTQNASSQKNTILLILIKPKSSPTAHNFFYSEKTVCRSFCYQGQNCSSFRKGYKSQKNMNTVCYCSGIALKECTLRKKLNWQARISRYKTARPL